MPAQPAWLVQLPAIRAELERLLTPVLDRAAIETLFGVGRRRAITLLHQFGGYLAGKTFLVDRASLLRQLEALETGAEFAQERSRRQRVSEELGRARGALQAKSVPIAASSEALGRSLDELPAVELGAGELRIRFESAEELLGHLLELAQSIQHDFRAFEERCRGFED